VKCNWAKTVGTTGALLALMAPNAMAATPNTGGATRLMSIQEPVSWVKGVSGVAQTPDSVAAVIRATWAYAFGNDAADVTSGNVHLNITGSIRSSAQGSIQQTPDAKTPNLRGVLKLGGDTFPLSSTDVSVYNRNTSAGTYTVLDVIGTIGTKHDTRNMAMAVIFKPGDNRYQVSMTIHDPVQPISLAFGPSVADSATLKELFTASSAPTTPSLTQNAVSPDSSSSQWNWVANNSTNVLGGTTISGPSCVVVASDEVNPSTNDKDVRDQVWAGTAAINYLRNQDPNGQGIEVEKIEFALNGNGGAFDTISHTPSSSTPNPLASWTWTLSYIPNWTASLWNAFANYLLSLSQIGDDTASTGRFVQTHYIVPNQTYAVSTNHPASGTDSYSMEYDTNVVSTASPTAQVDGLVEYYDITSNGVAIPYDSNWVYANGNLN